MTKRTALQKRARALQTERGLGYHAPPGRPCSKRSASRTIEGVGVRVAQRILAMTCAIRDNRTIGAPITRSFIAYDH